MNKKICFCNNCSHDKYILVEKKKICVDNKGRIILQYRQCLNCCKRYKVAYDGIKEFYF